ncbi:MAG: hypothetical protein WCG78_02085 [Candidatus Omnitrophota bacterium]
MKKNTVEQPVIRVIDANFNRAREGLRVGEEYVRFFAGDASITAQIKKMRSAISALQRRFTATQGSLIDARDVRSDVGRKGFSTEKMRSSSLDIFLANMNRSKEALRVLEEFSKLLSDLSLSDRCRRLRYQLYALEQSSLKLLTGKNRGNLRRNPL